MAKQLLREYYELCDGGSCQDLLTEREKREVQNGATYAKNYANETKKGYLNRVKHIYKPKAEFLKNSLKKINNINSYSILDVGCGSGYFVYALTKIGFNNVKVHQTRDGLFCQVIKYPVQLFLA